MVGDVTTLVQKGEIWLFLLIYKTYYSIFNTRWYLVNLTVSFTIYKWFRINKNKTVNRYNIHVVRTESHNRTLFRSGYFTVTVSRYSVDLTPSIVIHTESVPLKGQSPWDSGIPTGSVFNLLRTQGLQTHHLGVEGRRLCVSTSAKVVVDRMVLINGFVTTRLSER